MRHRERFRGKRKRGREGESNRVSHRERYRGKRERERERRGGESRDEVGSRGGSGALDSAKEGVSEFERGGK